MFVDKVLHNEENKTEPIVICEYGTADGGISMFLMKQLIGLKHSFLHSQTSGCFLDSCIVTLQTNRSWESSNKVTEKK